MNKSIYSLAYLQYTYEVLGKDILDLYVPMFCKCLLHDKVSEVDLKKMKETMNAIYGINNITYGAIHSICNRMTSQKYGILEKKNGVFHVVNSKLNGYQLLLNKDDNIIEEFNQLVKKISEFSLSFPQGYKFEEVERGLLNFIDLHGIDMLLGHSSNVFNAILKKEDKRLSYVISRYILQDKEEGGNALEILNRLAKGNAISNLVSLSVRNNFVGSLKDVVVIIDTPFFYNLLGANNESNREAAVELMTILKRNGASFSMYQHNLNEVYATLDDAVNRLHTHDYDLRKSSRLLKMAVAEGYSSMQMDMMRANIEIIRKEWGIAEEEVPNTPNGYKDINVALLTEIIDSAYTNNHSRALFYYEKNMLSKDVDSINYTYRLRGNSVAQNLKGCKTVMLTTNKIIATTSNDERINEKKHIIPVCVTDIFLSTILWSNYPGENDKLNKKILISECYNNVQLDDALMIRFFEDVKEKKINNDITESQYLMITTSRLAKSMLRDITQNDINAYTDRTSCEIMNIIEQEHKDEIEKVRMEGVEKVQLEKEHNRQEIERIQKEHNKEIAEISVDVESLKEKIKRVDNYCKTLAAICSNVIMIFISVLLCFSFFAKRYWSSDLVQIGAFALWCWYIIDAFLSLWAFLSWLGLIWKFADMKKYFYKKIYALLRRRLMFE